MYATYFLAFHAVWGKTIILGRMISQSITLFLVCNLCVALWRGWLVWHHQQPGLLPVWRRRLLPVHTLHQEGTQTEISDASPPVYYIYALRESLTSITFHHTHCFVFLFNHLKGGKVMCGWLSARILQSRWSLESEAGSKAGFFLFTVVEIRAFWHKRCAAKQISTKQTNTDHCYFPLSPVNDCTYLVSLICT